MKLFLFSLFMFKRYLKNIPFVIILVLIPLCCLFLRNIGMTENIKVKVGIYSESDMNTDRLYEYDGAAEFIYYDDLESLKKDVSGRKTECGYYFTDSLPVVYNSDNIKNSIICYKSPATVFHKVIDEIIFSELFYSYAYDILRDFSAEHFHIREEELFSAYNSFLNTDAVISIEYEYIDGISAENEAVNPFGFLRGILGIFIMLGGLLGGFYAIRDFGGGFGKTFSPISKTLLSYAYFIVPALLCGLSSFIGLSFGGMGSADEVLSIFLFSLTSAVFGALIYCFFGNEKSLISVITALVLASLIFCPVFADTGSFIKTADIISKILIPTYYIENFLLLPLIFCTAASFICSLIKNNIISPA